MFCLFVGEHILVYFCLCIKNESIYTHVVFFMFSETNICGTLYSVIYFFALNSYMHIVIMTCLSYPTYMFCRDMSDDTPSNWSKLPGQMCKLPNSMMLSLPAGKMGCLVLAFSHDGRQGLTSITMFYSLVN